MLMPIPSQERKLKSGRNTQEALHKVILIAFICLSSLLGGTVLPVPFYIIQIASFIVIILFYAQLCKKDKVVISYPKASFLFLCFLGVVILQCIPLPQAIIKLFSPNTIKLYDEFSLTGASSFSTFSIYLFATHVEIIRTISFFLLFLATINLIRTKNQVKAIVLSIIAVTSAITFFGIAKKYLAHHDIAVSFGVFSNKNYYAGFALMVVPLCLGYTLYVKESHKKIIFSFLSVVLSASIVLSQSRAAMLGLVCSIFVMAAYLLKKKINIKREIPIILIVFFACTALIYFANTEGVEAKFRKTHRAFSSRSLAYLGAVSAIKDYPLFGVGLGNYGQISGLYREIPVSNIDPYLHNDHLQFILEAGILAAIFYGFFFMFLCKDMIVQLHIRNDPFVKYILLGGLCGIMGLIIHSSLEMLFPVPAISFMFWIFLGLIYKTGYISSHKT